MTIKRLTNRKCLIIPRYFVGPGVTSWQGMTGFPRRLFLADALARQLPPRRYRRGARHCRPGVTQLLPAGTSLGSDRCSPVALLIVTVGNSRFTGHFSEKGKGTVAKK